MTTRFADRVEAGRLLGELFDDVRQERPLVYGIPRGGVVVAHEVAEHLGCPLEVLIVRKLGYPGHEEAAFGALGEGGVVIPQALEEIGPADRGHEVVEDALASRQAEIEAQIRMYRGDRPRRLAAGATAIVVDDGIATGYTFAAALAIVRRDRPLRVMAAIPVATVEGAALAGTYCDEVRILKEADPSRFFAVSLHYDSFGQVSDERVVELIGSPSGRPS